MIFWLMVPPASTASLLARPQVLRFCAQICYSSRSPCLGSHGKPTSAPHGIFVRDSCGHGGVLPLDNLSFTTAENRRPGAHHGTKDLDPLYQGLPLEEHLCLSLGSAALLKSPQSKNFVSFLNAQVNYVQTRPK